MQFLQEVKKWLGEFTEIALLLIAIGITFEILFGAPAAGTSIPFFSGVVTNLTSMLNKFGENGLAGLIALGIILYLFNRRRFVSPQHHQQ